MRMPPKDKAYFYRAIIRHRGTTGHAVELSSGRGLNVELASMLAQLRQRGRAAASAIAVTAILEELSR